MTIEAQLSGTIGLFELDARFTIPSSGITALFGPSGCGKTSVLRCIAGLNHLPGSQLSINGETWQNDQDCLPSYKRPIGYVFQEANLFSHLSVKDNLLFGYKRSKTRDKTPSLDEVIQLLGLEHLLNRSPDRLSGGERQRVAIGRALMAGPEILLMDEPLAALDRFSKNEILPYLERLHDQLDIPVLYVSHDIAEVERLADHMVLMDKGRVKASGPLAELLADPDLPLAAMPDAAAVLEGVVTDFDPDYHLSTLVVSGGQLQVAGDIGQVGSMHRLRIAASDVALCRQRAPQGSSILNGPIAKIISTEDTQAHQKMVFLKLGEDGAGGWLLAKITRKSWDALQLKEGEVVYALIKGVALAK